MSGFVQGCLGGHPEILSGSFEERRRFAVSLIPKQREWVYFLTVRVFQDPRAWVKPNVVREPNDLFFYSLRLSSKAGSVPRVLACVSIPGSAGQALTAEPDCA